MVLPYFIGPAIVGWQIYNWLRTAQWQSIDVSDGLKFIGIPHPTFGWPGLQKISDALLQSPLSIFVFAIYLAAFLTLMVYLEGAAKKKHAAK
jgi:hypothetical protein